MMTLAETAEALQARFTAPAAFTHVDSDTRNLRPGALFVALRGDRFDGHDFLAAAAAAGAAAALVDERGAEKAGSLLPLLVVANTRAALGVLAAHWRMRFDIPVIGITGSNGKTSVKEMCASILRAHCRLNGENTDKVLATPGNLNNDIGVPLTLLSLRSSHRAAIVEMGMNHPGEIAYLARLARPTVAVVTNAQRAHLLGMKSVAEIAREKGSLYEGLREDGVAVINADDAYVDYWRQVCAERPSLSFGLAGGANVRGVCDLHGLTLELSLETPQGKARLGMQVAGEHNARNALAAAAACLAAGVELPAVVAGLTEYRGAHGRLTQRNGIRGATILDDSYNANPDSVRAGIDVLAALDGRKFLVLGDMGEIGMTSAQAHDEIGGYAKSKGVDALFALGDMSAVAAHNFGDGGEHFRSVEELVAALTARLDAGTAVLVKGSRFMRMERIVEKLADGSSGNGSNGVSGGERVAAVRG